VSDRKRGELPSQLTAMKSIPYKYQIKTTRTITRKKKKQQDSCFQIKSKSSMFENGKQAHVLLKVASVQVTPSKMSTAFEYRRLVLQDQVSEGRERKSRQRARKQLKKHGRSRTAKKWDNGKEAFQSSMFLPVPAASEHSIIRNTHSYGDR
jgi:hypothetical protein